MKRLTIENVDFENQAEMDALDEQMMAAGIERVRAEGDDLRRRGLLDEHGNVCLKELPADMQKDAQRDFGG